MGKFEKVEEIPTKQKKSYKYHYIREHINDFLIDWKEGLLNKFQLEEKYQCPYYIMSRIAQNNKTTRSNKEYPIEDICLDYQDYKLRIPDILIKYNISESTLDKIIKNNNISFRRNNDVNRKYSFNEHYFDNIDDEHKAYWLGFIYADGSHNEKRHTLRITLNSDDDYILKQFQIDLNNEREIQYTFNKTYNKYYSYIYVQSTYFSEQLVKVGVVSNKSFKITFPNDDIVPYHLKRHFIRGYFDGDGGISIPKNIRKINYSIVGNYDFLEDMRQFLLNNIENYGDISLYKHSLSEVYFLSRGGRYVVQKFMDWIYKDATIFLTRKHDRYLELVEYNKEKDND